VLSVYDRLLRVEEEGKLKSKKSAGEPQSGSIQATQYSWLKYLKLGQGGTTNTRVSNR